MPSLPARANLEHLRNEAKQRLRAMRATTPGARLADAQLAVARAYGFPSWRKLKTYVDALGDVGPRLLEAVRAGDLDTLRAILDRHPELVDAATDLERLLRPSDAPAMRLLHLAIAENRIDVARLLIERGANLNVRNADGRQPLHDCFELARDEIQQLLLDAGAEPDVSMAAALGLHERLRQILEQDPAQANDLTTGMSPLGWTSYGNQAESARILIAHGAILDRPPFDAEAWGPVTHVANLNIARVLLAHGASPNCRNRHGDTPIHAAIESRLVRDPTAFVEFLLASGADPAIRNHDGRTALEEALEQSGRNAETYFPARPVGLKKLDRVIQLLRDTV
jgi:hypothetical protein